ncbi:MAG: nitrilase-related carbon-nitrogen hydrolase [Bacteroidota bacterium]|nr:nitrilase-related carbon-nitrogen hydrolase [Bacteroidota bacterium]
MRITLIQDIIFWADKAANLQKVEDQLILLAGKTDLVVLPEMFTTGFCTDKLQLAETMEGETVQTLQNWAMKYKLAIIGSFIAIENGKIYNRSFFVFPTGRIETADKRHLFTFGGEHEYFSAGDKRLIVNYGGFNILVLVCYDVRFPVWSRNRNNEYDLVVFVANFPQRRIIDWDILLQARAVENQAYVCGVNRVGVDGFGIEYNGHSALLDFKAATLLKFPGNKTSIQTAEINIEPLQLYRHKFAVSLDADEFEIK